LEHRGAGTGVGLSKSGLVLSGCVLDLLANGLWFRSSEAVFGSWLAGGFDWMLKGRSKGVLLYAMHTTACLDVLALDAMCILPQSRPVPSAQVAMLKCGDYLPMANVVQLTIGVTSSLGLATLG
jgi:hypothetical protein